MEQNVLRTQEPDASPEWKIKPKSSLDNFVKKRGDDIEIYIWEEIEDVFFKTNILTISISYIKCVKLDEIEIPMDYSSSKMEKNKNWATPDMLCESFPDIKRKYDDLNSDNKKKYHIVDGRHRIKRAKEFGMKCIKAMVTDEVKVNKTDTKNIELKKK